MKRIRNRSLKFREQQEEYKKLSTEFIKSHPECERCGGKTNQVFHRKGRVGELLTAVEYYVAVCEDCSEWIDDHKTQAKDAGWILSRSTALT